MIKIKNIIKKKRNFILYSSLRVQVMVLGLITNIFIVRKLSIHDFGIFSVAFVLIGLITTFGFSWSSSSILYYGSREKAKHGTINKTFWSRNIIIFISLIITTIMFSLFRKQINHYIGLEVAFLILIWLYVSVAEDYLSQYLLAVKRQICSSMVSITAKVIYIILIILIPFDVETLIKLNIVSQATVLIYIFVIKKGDIGKFEFDKSWFKEVLNFSLWQFFGFSGLYLINFGDTAVIKHFMTTEDVGIYSVAYKLFINIAGFSYVISSYYASNISSYFENKEYKKLRSFFYKERFIIFTISTLGHVIVMIFAKPIIILLYGVRYVQAANIINVLMLGSIFRYLWAFYVLYFNINTKHKILQQINIFRAILNVVLDIIFIKIFGLIGPAIATTIAIISTVGFSAVYSEKRIKSFCFNIKEREKPITKLEVEKP